MYVHPRKQSIRSPKGPIRQNMKVGDIFYRVFMVLRDTKQVEVKLQAVLINQFYEESSTWSRYVEC